MTTTVDGFRVVSHRGRCTISLGRYVVTTLSSRGGLPGAKRARARLSLSVVVVVINIPREAPRTLLSLSAAYQHGLRADEYDVIVADDGSNPAVAHTDIESFGPNFRLIRMEPASPSPVAAVNRGLAEPRGQIIGVNIDGARMAVTVYGISCPSSGSPARP